MSNEYKTHKLTHDGTNPDCQWCDENSINVEPSWINLAELAIAMLQDSNRETVDSGKVIIRDMAEKLARVRAAQPDCPEHLRNVESALI